MQEQHTVVCDTGKDGRVAAEPSAVPLPACCDLPWATKQGPHPSRHPESLLALLTVQFVSILQEINEVLPIKCEDNH